MRSFLPINVGNWWNYESDAGLREMWVVTRSESPVILTRYTDKTPVLAWALQIYDNRIDLLEVKEIERSVQYSPAISILRAGNTRQQWGYHYEFQNGKVARSGAVVAVFDHVAAETVTVKAGTFNTQRVVWSVTFGEYEESHEVWFAEGVGIVKEIITLKEGGEEVSRTNWELVSYGIH